MISRMRAAFKNLPYIFILIFSLGFSLSCASKDKPCLKRVPAGYECCRGQAVPADQCCGSAILGPEEACCGGDDVMNLKTDICCAGQVYDRKSVECCDRTPSPVGTCRSY